LRLYGRGEIVRPDSAKWQNLHRHFETILGTRQIVVLHVESLQTSCGFAVPLYEFETERPKLVEWAEKKGEQGIVDYWHEKNVRSIDGLPTSISGD
jgi:hypothetical protein